MSKLAIKRRETDGKFARTYSAAQITRQWLLWLLSMGMFYGVTRFMASDFAAFRSCNHNDTGISISNCGKQGVNVGDLAVLALFILSLLVAVGLFNRALRMTRKQR